MSRKAHLLPTSPGKFDSSMQLSKQSLGFFPWVPSLSFAGERLFSFVNGWSKSLSLVFPIANYAPPPLFFMSSVLHLLPLTVKPSIGLKPPTSKPRVFKYNQFLCKLRGHLALIGNNPTLYAGTLFVEAGYPLLTSPAFS